MTSAELRALLDRVHRRELDPDTAHDQLHERLRNLPFEDLGFARVDHHRAIRQGFPEVVLGIGKSPAQIAAIAQSIVSQGQTLLITRVDRRTWDEVSAAIPGVEFHETAQAITLKQSDIQPGLGTVLVVAAGTSDLQVAEEAAVTAETMGNRVDR